MALVATAPKPMAPMVGPQQQTDLQSLVLACNKDGMDSLRKGQLKAAFEQFKYAEAILTANQSDGDNTSLLAVTFNNLGSYYKKTGKLHGALSYLRRALRMELDLDTDEVTLAGTHLNICAILSKLEKHDKALQHALSALDLINNRVESTPPEHVSQDDYSVLAIAYHNVAVERDLLHEYEKAATAFKQGYQVAKRCLGEDHPLTLTLAKNCEAVVQKTRKMAALPSATTSSSRFGVDLLSPKEVGSVPMLPRIGVAAGKKGETLPMQQSPVLQEATDWVATESAAWSNFAQRTLGGDFLGARDAPMAPPPQQVAPQFPPPPLSSTSSLAAMALRDSQVHDLTGASLGTSFSDTSFTVAPRKAPFIRKTALHTAIEDNADEYLDMIGRDGHHAVTGARSAPFDYRPNRMIKGATRTSKAVRRTGLSNSTKHRDLVMSGRLVGAGAAQKTAYQRKIAAERIQRVWRSWYKYCQENHDWMTTTWVAATMIQAKWRSYHVRRQKLDKAATCIQRHVRGHLVRRVLRKHRAAVAIQRHVIGMLTRMQLRRLQVAATKIQCLARGAAARRRVRAKRKHLTHTALTIQCALRQFIARRVTGEKRAARNMALARHKASTDIQRLFRGHKGRKRAAMVRAKYYQDVKEYRAATKLQSMARRDFAIKRVDRMRVQELEKMNKAAIHIRKVFMGHRSRKKYLQLLSEFARHEAHVRTIQRYARGFLVRLRMWREAIRAEEELWAATEIQRVWRGYVGRVRWENQYEELWRREMAAAMIQRNMRGWVARCCVGRMRRRLARAEFERARRRFRASQQIQALTRGVLVRKVTRARRARKLNAIIHIQRIWRGHRLRQRLWEQVIELRATMIQAVARGFLTRNRRFHLVAITICIQRAYRCWRRKPFAVRQRAFEEMRRRKENARLIQRTFRKHQESKRIEEIQHRG